MNPFQYNNEIPVTRPVRRTKQAAMALNGRSEGIKYNCLHGYKNQSYTLVIDWLQYTCKLNTRCMMLGADFVHSGHRWLYKKGGTKIYKHRYEVFIGNVHAFSVCVSPHKSKDENIALVKLENWVLYADWYSYHKAFEDAFIDEIIRISRLDVAFDGLNYIMDAVHEFATDKTERNYKMIGKTTINAYNINRRTKVPNGYKLGSPKGHKNLSIYNKSKELKKGNKPYIKDYWKLNGLQCETDIYRTEFRMMSGFLGRVESGNYHTITDRKGVEKKVKKVFLASEMMGELRAPGFLIGLCNLFVKGFFEFIYKDNKNVSRCTRIDMIPTATIQYQKSELVARPTNYKAKLSLHNMYAQICDDTINAEDSLRVMQYLLGYYELYDWYSVKIFEWDKLYVDKEGLKGFLHALPHAAPKQVCQKRFEQEKLIYEKIQKLSFDYSKKKLNAGTKNNGKGL